MDQKVAQTKYPVIGLIRERWSPRHYRPGTISATELNTMIEAASWSFSSGNLQPWHYLYAHRDTPGFNRILEHCTISNQAWAKNAAVLMVSLAKKERDPGKPNFWSRHDLGAANMLLILQARSMNIYGHPFGGFDSAAMASALEIDTSVFEPVACIALGYPGDPDQLEESKREKEIGPRKRKEIGEFSHNINAS
jgi:nitroreductase